MYSYPKKTGLSNSTTTVFLNNNSWLSLLKSIDIFLGQIVKKEFITYFSVQDSVQRLKQS